MRGGSTLISLVAVLATLVPTAAAAAPREHRPAPRANLVVRAVSAPPARLGRQSLMKLKLTVRNAGHASAEPSDVRAYLSTDRRKSKGDLVLDGMVESRTIRARRSARLSARTFIPATAPLAGRYVLVCADAYNDVRESNEKDNCVASKRKLTVLAAGTTPVVASTDTLIDQAVAAHRISAEQGVIYHVYDQFADPRLPDAYQGTAGPQDDLLMATVQQNLKSYSATTQAKLAPFLVAPMYVGSWWQQRYDPGASQAHSAAGDYRCGRIGDGRWSYLDAIGIPIRVWWQDGHPDDEALAKKLLLAYETKIWPDVTGLMGRKPLSDGTHSGLFCNGGNGSYDVDLLDLNPRLDGQTDAPDCNGSAARTTINRNTHHLIGNATHEFMHAVQYAFPMDDSCSKTMWWMDATAEWAVQYVYPSDDTEHRFDAKFLSQSDKPLNYDPAEFDGYRYGSNLYAFFLAQRAGPNAIRASFEAMASQPTIDAVDAVSGGLPNALPDFARFLIHEPEDPDDAPADALTADRVSGEAAVTAEDGRTLSSSVTDEDGQLLLGSPATSIKLDLGASGDVEKKLPVSVVHLSSRIYWFETDAATRSLAIAAPQPDNQAIKIQLLGLRDGKWHPVDGPYDHKLLCRSDADENFTQLLLIYTNPAKDSDGDWTASADEQPKVIASNIGCDYKVTSHFEQQVSVDILAHIVGTSSADGTFELVRDKSSDPDFFGYQHFVAINGSASGTYTNNIMIPATPILSAFDCTQSASLTGTVLPIGDAPATLDVNFFAEPPARRRYRGNGDFVANLPELAPDCGFPGPAPSTGFFFTAIGDPHVDAAGKLSGNGETTGIVAPPDYQRAHWTGTPVP